MDAWRERAAALVVDALRGPPPGSVHRLEVGRDPLPHGLGGVGSTHAASLADAIELSRALGTLPARALVLGVGGASFEAGEPLSAAVAARVPELTAAARGLLAELA